MKIRLLFAIGLLIITCGVRAEPSEKIILGDWCAGSDNAYHEYFSLTIEDGNHIFSSWLHDRPADSGKWTLSKQSLLIKKESGLIYNYFVEKLTPSQLILRENGQASETYVRKKCRRFEPPPTE